MGFHLRKIGSLEQNGKEGIKTPPKLGYGFELGEMQGWFLLDESNIGKSTNLSLAIWPAIVAGMKRESTSSTLPFSQIHRQRLLEREKRGD